MRGTLAALSTLLLLTGCSADNPPPAAEPVTVTVARPLETPQPQSMTAWKQATADEIRATGTALTAVGDSMTNYDLPAMRVNCTRLRSSVDQLERALPSPDTAVNTALQGSIDDFRSLSQLCMTITPGSGNEEIDAMGDLVDSGSDHLYDAFDLMGLNVHR